MLKNSFRKHRPQARSEVVALGVKMIWILKRIGWVCTRMWSTKLRSLRLLEDYAA